MTTMLIVDDELDMRMLVRLVIEMANDGLKIVGEAADGPEAIQIWRDLDGPPVPDVVILDNRMPGLSGMEVAQRILEERPGQIIVLYSAFLDADVRAQAAEVGIRTCVSKHELDRLPDLIRELTAA
ncbi:MAG TPA: response regulator transcription factor [Acidimicrobiales bacterium]|jgi:CheY-like chemotaxis protein|nr:response regulator transcription factor [Acidimicrobiales bacterium]